MINDRILASHAIGQNMLGLDGVLEEHIYSQGFI